MRHLFFCCLFFTACATQPTPIKEDNSLFPFRGDSGTLTNSQIMPFVIDNQIFTPKEIEYLRSSAETSNTIMAKYYQMGDKGHYLVEITSDPMYVIEVMPDSTIRNKQAYSFETILCDMYEPPPTLGKIGDYFFLRRKAYYYSDTLTKIYLFKNLLSQELVNWICESSARQIHHSNDDYFEYVIGTPKPGQDSILMHYELIRQCADSTKQFIREYDVTFTRSRGKWLIADSTQKKDYKRLF